MDAKIIQPPSLERDLGRVERPLEAAVIAAALLTIPLVYLQEQGADGPLIALADWSIWAVFAIDLGLHLWVARDFRVGLRRYWFVATVAVLSFPALPGLLQLVRLARLTRLLRVLRLGVVTPRALAATRHILWRQGVFAVAGATGILIAGGAGMLVLLEPEAVPGGFLDGVWWGIVTATTTGYGDIAPQSPLGRLVGVAIMLAGIGLFSTLAASTAAHFIGQEDCENLSAIARRLDEINARLEQLQQQIDRGPSVGTAGPDRPKVAAGGESPGDTR